jgi:hypothetical protein
MLKIGLIDSDPIYKSMGVFGTSKPDYFSNLLEDSVN